MKKSLQTIIVLIFTNLLTFNLSAQNAPNISFTDIDGQTHDLYTYLDSGYNVLLDFSFESCAPV